MGGFLLVLTILGNIYHLDSGLTAQDCATALTETIGYIDETGVYRAIPRGGKLTCELVAI